MCLIAYVKAGSAMPESYFRAAAHDNADGIGIMSADGVEKFLGRKMVKRAWRYTRRLHEANAEFAVHFRFATHGRVALINTHPFRTPDGNAYVMHNGILSNYTPKHGRDADMSDTRAMVEVMQGVDVEGDAQYWDALADHIGWHNKLCVMSRDGQFRLVNEDAGDWISGVWYSQTYSLPNYGGQDVWWTKYTDRGNGMSDTLSTYATGGYVPRDARQYYVDAQGKYHEFSNAPGENVALLPYETRSAAAALVRQAIRQHSRYCVCVDCVNAAYERIHAKEEGAQHTHGLPSGTYAMRDDAALDAELDKHFAECATEEEPTDICPSCEHIHSSGRQCPECGYIDMSDGMLDGYQCAAKAG